MTTAQYHVFEALNPFFGVVLKGLRGLVDGKHYFDTFADDALFESRYQLSRLASGDTRARQSDGKPRRIRQDDQTSLRRRNLLCIAPGIAAS